MSRKKMSVPLSLTHTLSISDSLSSLSPYFSLPVRFFSATVSFLDYALWSDETPDSVLPAIAFHNEY